MALKQFQNSLMAPDGSQYVTLTDGAGNLVAATQVGITNGTSAAAGNVGQILRADVLLGSAVALTTNTATQIASLSLTAGNWIVYSNLTYNLGATTSVTQLLGVLSATTASLTATDVNMGVNVSDYSSFVPGSVSISAPFAGIYISQSGTASIFLNCRAQFTVSTLSAYGSIVAVRVS